MNLSRYLHQPHPEGCDCSVCWSRRETARPRSLPVHTLHRVPPRVGPKGRWTLEADACLHLRETHPKQPTAQVLARCARHRQTNALRAPARTVRTGGVSA